MCSCHDYTGEPVLPDRQRQREVHRSEAFPRRELQNDWLQC